MLDWLAPAGRLLSFKDSLVAIKSETICMVEFGLLHFNHAVDNAKKTPDISGEKATIGRLFVTNLR